MRVSFILTGGYRAPHRANAASNVYRLRLWRSSFTLLAGIHHVCCQYSADFGGGCGARADCVGASSGGMGMDGISRDLPPGDGVRVLDSSAVSTGEIADHFRAGEEVGDARPVLKDPESDLCVWIVRDGRIDPDLGAPDLATALSHRDSIAVVESAERSFRARGLVRGRIS